ncbi:MAG: hypothetical protein V1813_00205 [Candidatus Aenigmatarchaeota archaeon]
MKGQTSMAVIVIAMVMLVFLAIFILTTSEPAGNAVAKAEYRKLYATNMLLSILNTETVDCGSFSDMLKAAHYGGGKCDWEEFGKRIGVYVPEILLLSGHPEYDWQIVSSPKDSDGDEMSWGNEKLKDEPRGRWDATTMLTLGGTMLDVKIYMKTK